MLDNSLSELIIATAEVLGLEDSVIEKDYYVTQIILALSQIRNDFFELVFCGGTCLAKAHKIIQRMSEDVDFKIQLKTSNVYLSKTRKLKELKNFRESIKATLTLLNFTLGNSTVRDEGQYSCLEINYSSVFSAKTGLRSDILLEFTISESRLSTIPLDVKTLIEETLDNVIVFELSTVACISIEETAIEKWVGLTRRVAAIERAYIADDETLIRHVYDLNTIKQLNGMTENFFNLAGAIISNDARQFKNQHPEYAAHPINEIQLSLALLKSNSLWKERYQRFIEEMVYGRSYTPAYENAIDMLEHISERIVNVLVGSRLLQQDLALGYREMAQDKAREQAATDWGEGLLGDLDAKR